MRSGHSTIDNGHSAMGCISANFSTCARLISICVMNAFGCVRNSQAQIAQVDIRVDCMFGQRPPPHCKMHGWQSCLGTYRWQRCRVCARQSARDVVSLRAVAPRVVVTLRAPGAGDVVSLRALGVGDVVSARARGAARLSPMWAPPRRQRGTFIRCLLAGQDFATGEV